ncbi:MAG TPA: hypothetical protein VI299_17735 [Polyangiales bacterium]
MLPEHVTAAAVPPAQYCPAVQGAQVGVPVPDAGEVCRVPGAHEPVGTHWLAFTVAE